MKVTNNIQEPEILNRTILWKLNRLGYLKLLFLGKRKNRKQQKTHYNAVDQKALSL